MFKLSFRQYLSTTLARLFKVGLGQSPYHPILQLLRKMREQSQDMSQFRYWHRSKSYNFAEDVCAALDFVEEHLMEYGPKLNFQFDFTHSCQQFSRSLEQQICKFEAQHLDRHGIGVATLRDIILQIGDETALERNNSHFLSVA